MESPNEMHERERHTMSIIMEWHRRMDEPGVRKYSGVCIGGITLQQGRMMKKIATKSARDKKTQGGKIGVNMTAKGEESCSSSSRSV
jgi:hypothetical protein